MNERPGINPIFENDILEFKQSHMRSTVFHSRNPASLGINHSLQFVGTMWFVVL